MSLEVLQDTRVRLVPWKDLQKLNPLEVSKELFLPLPWLGLSWYCAFQEYYLLALFFSFFFFLAGLRQVHDAFHYNLGISRKLTERVIFMLSTLMLGSMHAIQFNHLKHHKHCMDEEDVEAFSAHLKFWQAILSGPYFPILLHYHALQKSNNRIRSWILLELGANLALLGMIFFWLPYTFLKYHVIVMLVGHCFTAFFAVWTVHHDCERSYLIARTLRNPLKSFIALNMFFHMEHHLFPKVPTCHLPTMAKRLDLVAPELSQKQVY